VLGQSNFASHGVNIAKPNGMYSPEGIAVDNSGAAPHHLYVADTKNNRVLGWHDAAGFANGSAPDLIIGQPGSTSVDCGTAINRLCAPRGLAIDGAGDLLVADTGNSRVLVFITPFVTDTNADFVLGQSNFTTANCGLSSTAMCAPAGVWADASGNVWVADTTNHRVLKFKGPISNGKAASLVLGQANFTSGKCNRGGAVTGASLCFPNAVASDKSGHVYVSDNSNSRVLEYASPSVSGTPANRVFGQTTLGGHQCAAGGPTKTSLCEPEGVWVDNAGRLYIADTSLSRVLEYDKPLTSSSANRVFGQNGDFSRDFCSPNLQLDAKVLCTPAAVAVQNNPTPGLDNVYIADTGFNRALGFNAPLNTPGAPIANRVAGQLDFVHDGVNIPDAHSLFNPKGIALDTSVVPNRLYVADTGNNRILRWNSAAAFLNGAPANLVIGQPDFTHVDAGTGPNGGLNQPVGLAVHKGDLWVADAENSRVVRFKAPVNAGAVLDISIGQVNLLNNQCNNISGINARTVCFPLGLGFDSANKLYVADVGNSRVLEYDPPQSTNEAAHLLFGQANFSAGSCNRGGLTGALTLCDPFDVALDSAARLYIADTANSRVVQYTPGVANPIHVYGEPDFLTNTGCGVGTSASTLCSPLGIRLDSGNRLMVADNASRVLRYFHPQTKFSADQVFGQPNFASNGCGLVTSASTLCRPGEAVADSAGNIYIADTNNNRVLEYNSPPVN
jgi:sugar lactone lactonase YvrE